MTVSSEAHEAETEARCCTLDVVDRRNEVNATHSLEVEYEAPCSYARTVVHQPAPNDTDLPIVKIRGGGQMPPNKTTMIFERSNECFPNDTELGQGAPEEPEPPDVWADARRPVPEPVDLALAYPVLRPSLTFKYQRRSKPPDNGGGSR